MVTRQSFGWFVQLSRIVYVSLCVHSFCCVFSPTFSVGCALGFCLVASPGRNIMGAAALKSSSTVTKCGCSCANMGEKRISQGVWQHWNIIATTLILKLGRLIDALGLDFSVVSNSGGSNVHVEAFCKYLGNGYRQKMIDCPNFDLCLFRRCLQRTTSNVFGSLEGFAMTEFFVNRLKSGETRN